MSLQSNIFLKSEGEALSAAIGDFGSAKLENPDMIVIAKSTASTSIAWTPPEYVSEHTVDYSSPTVAGDIWSFGCTILEVRMLMTCLNICSFLSGTDRGRSLATFREH